MGGSTWSKSGLSREDGRGKRGKGGKGEGGNGAGEKLSGAKDNQEEGTRETSNS